MKYIYHNLITFKEENIDTLKNLLIKKLSLKSCFNIIINKKSFDTRKNKGNVVYSLIFDSPINLKETLNLKLYEDQEIVFTPLIKKDYLIVGMGPAGLFFALLAFYRGLKMTIIERGKCIEERVKDLN
ncbi:MAG: hypothetical protein LBM99_02655, partial [Bacillales bacterium]|nr:hypothetical protein [Bacillales bacterium]